MAIDTETMQAIERCVARAVANATSLKGAADEISKGVTQYVGARYVPLFANPLQHDKSREYEPLTIVLDKGNSYTSRQFVPSGVELTNESFWAMTGNFNAQIELYRQEVKSLDGRITENAQAIETETTNRTAAVTAEMERAHGAEQTLQANIEAEKTRAEGAEQTLRANIEAEKTRAEGAEQTLRANIEAEKTRAEGAEQTLQAKTVKLNSFSSDFHNTFITKELFFSVDYNDYLALGYPSIQGSAYDQANDTLYLCAHNTADNGSIVAKYTNFKNGGTDRKWSSYIRLQDNHHCGGACFFDNKVFINDYKYNVNHITVVDCTTFTELEQIVLPYHGLVGIAGFKNINNNDENNSVRMLVGRGDNGNVINGYAYDTSTYPYVFKNICTVDELNANIQYSQGACTVPSGVIFLYSYVFDKPFKTSYISIKPVIAAGRECVYPIYQNPDEPFEELEDVFQDGTYLYTNTVTGKIYKLCPVGALNLQDTWYGNLVTNIVFTKNKGTIVADSNKVTFDNYWCFRLSKKIIENDSVHIPITISFQGMLPISASISAAQKTVHLCKRTSDFKKIDLFFDAYLTTYGNARLEQFAMYITDTNGSITLLHNLNEIVSASDEKYRITDITIGLA